MNQSSENTQELIPKYNKITKKKLKKETLRTKKSKQLMLRVIPIERNWKQYNNIINFGGYMIDLDYEMDDSMYTITERSRATKQITDIHSIKSNKVNKTLQIFFSPRHSQQDYYKDTQDYSRLESIINILKSRNDQNLFYLSELIQQYNNRLKEHYLTEKFNHDVNKKQINSEENLQNYHFKKEEFLQYINEFLLEQEYPFYSYSIIGKNPQTFEYDGICYGFSEGLLALLGTSQEYAPDLFLRIGVVDFINRKSRFFSMLSSMKIFIERKIQEPFKINLRTYDFIEVPVIKRYERIQKDLNCPYELQAFIHIYEVEDYQLLQVIEKRKQNLHNSTITINNLDDPDFIYTCQKEYFLEKFYNISKSSLPI